MTRRGWTLHELLISLGVMSGVIAIAAHAATAQLRFLTGSSELAALRNQIDHASSIAASVLWGVSPIAGDIIVAQDSAVEVHMPIAASFACRSSPGFVTMPAAEVRGNTLSSFQETPEAGDRLLVLFEDSLGATWLTLRPAAAPTKGQPCANFSQAMETLTLPIQEQITVPEGAPLRFTRPVRLSLYRSSDRRWYLGTKEWNGESQTFNNIQPVAGPLNPYSRDPASTGLRFVYRDSDGFELPFPVEPLRIASITIVSRAASVRFQDSVTVTIALRNAR